MQNILGLTLEEALASLPAGEERPRIVETAAPRRGGVPRREGTLRIVACREGEWIVARFLDGAPKGKEES